MEFEEVVLWLLGSVFSLLAVLLLSNIFVQYGSGASGVHHGVIVDVTEVGMFCKTLEGTIVSGQGNASIKYNFTIENPVDVETLKAAMKLSMPITVKYKSPLASWRCNNSTSMIVIGIGE